MDEWVLSHWSLSFGCPLFVLLWILLRISSELLISIPQGLKQLYERAIAQLSYLIKLFVIINYSCFFGFGLIGFLLHSSRTSAWKIFRSCLDFYTKTPCGKIPGSATGWYMHQSSLKAQALASERQTSTESSPFSFEGDIKDKNVITPTRENA